MSILIVDDMDDERLLLERLLRVGGFTDVVMAESAIAAFKYLEVAESTETVQDIQLILMDLVMPKTDGLEACRRIKSSEKQRDIPIIMVTAIEDVEILKTALENGATDYITKPVNKIELLARVRSALRLKEEMDRRKARERELEELNRMLERLSFLDGLTGIPNRQDT